jgi:hypothetical protein
MKKLIILGILMLSFCFTQAQRFFYLESNNAGEQPLRESLKKASQYIVISQISSDYTIKTSIEVQKATKKISFNIIVEDSATLKAIFQTTEEYGSGLTGTITNLSIPIAMKTLIEKNINQIILCAENDHSCSMMKFNKLKKDKT